MVYGVLAIVALLTSMLSAIIGMGGGMLLLATLFVFLSHAEAIPTHAAVQLVSNSTRTVAFLRHVDWHTLGRFCVGAVPGGVIGVLVLVLLGGRSQSQQANAWLKGLVGVYILASLLIPRPQGQVRGGNWWDFPLLGVLAGAAAFTVGAVGPLIAPLFARRAFVKERLVATKAVCQSLLHLAKIPAFLLLRSYENLAALGALSVVMALLVVPGTLLGKRLLVHVSETRFVQLYRLALLFAGLKVLVFDAALPLVRQP
jgi:uncharacterized membrane protein YfcA